MKEILELIENLQPGEFILFPKARYLTAVFRDLRSLELLEYYNIFSQPEFESDRFFKDRTPDDLKEYIIYQDPSDFRKGLKHYVLEKEMEELVSGARKCANFPLILKESQENFGRQVSDSPNLYFVGATMSDEDYYYLYWDPTKEPGQGFVYDTCVGLMKNLSDTEKLPKSLYERLKQELSEYINDAMFPCSELSEEA